MDSYEPWWFCRYAITTSVGNRMSSIGVHKRALLGLTLAATALSRPAYGECIITPPPCEALSKASIVVLADVIEAAEPFEKVGPSTFRPVPQIVRLRVIERFKGVPREQGEITARISYNAETILLKQGVQYLVYAHQTIEGLWYTSCTRTKPAGQSSPEVEQLRQCGKQ